MAGIIIPPKVTVSNGGTLVGVEKQLNFIQGSNVTLITADDPTNGKVDVTIAASSSAGSRWDQISNPTTNLSLSMSAFTTSVVWGSSTGSSSLFNLTDSASNTGTGIIFEVDTALASAAKPFRLKTKGNLVFDTDSSGRLYLYGGYATGFNEDDESTGANITIDSTKGNWWKTVLQGANPLLLLNMADGQFVDFEILQDGTGGRTISTWPNFSQTFTATASANVLTVGYSLDTGTPITFDATGGGTLPTGISATNAGHTSNVYYAINQSSTTIKVASSLANAQAGIPITLTGGSGTCTIYTEIIWMNNYPNAITPPVLSTAAFGYDRVRFECIKSTHKRYHGYILSRLDTIDQVQTLTNKTISGASNTITNVSLTSGVTGVLPIANGGTALSTTPTDGQLLIGKTSTNNFSLATLTAGSNVTITNGAGSITIASTASGGGLTWNDVTGTSQTMAASNGYASDNVSLVTLTLPTTAAFGSIIEVTGIGAGGWKIAQNASQIIHFGATDTTTGTGGSLQSTNRRNSIKLVCVVTNNEWNVLSAQGNITIV